MSASPDGLQELWLACRCITTTSVLAHGNVNELQVPQLWFPAAQMFHQSKQ